MKHSKCTRSNGFIVHEYDINCLLDRDWQHRVKLIERWTLAKPNPVKFDVVGNRLMRRMKLLSSDAQCSIKKPNRVQIVDLALQLDDCHAIGLIHGDINAKNIGWDQDRLVVLDWEPSLVQRVGESARLMGTPPAIHPMDIKAFTLSAKSDRMAFWIWAQGFQPLEAARWSLQYGTLSEILV